MLRHVSSFDTRDLVHSRVNIENALSVNARVLLNFQSSHLQLHRRSFDVRNLDIDANEKFIDVFDHMSERASKMKKTKNEKKNDVDNFEIHLLVNLDRRSIMSKNWWVEKSTIRLQVVRWQREVSEILLDDLIKTKRENLFVEKSEFLSSKNVQNVVKIDEFVDHENRREHVDELDLKIDDRLVSHDEVELKLLSFVDQNAMKYVETIRIEQHQIFFRYLVFFVICLVIFAIDLLNS